VFGLSVTQKRRHELTVWSLMPPFSISTRELPGASRGAGILQNQDLGLKIYHSEAHETLAAWFVQAMFEGDKEDDS